MTLGDIASVTTLILFVFYFAGRFVTIIRDKSIFPDDIKVFGLDYNENELNVVETFELEDNLDDLYNTFVLTSVCGIYNLSVYRVLYDDELNRIGRKKSDKFQYCFLNKNQSLAFRLTSPELLPKYEVEYYTPDYKKVTIALWSNNKNGVMSESAKPKNTIRSVLYHIVK